MQAEALGQRIARWFSYDDRVESFVVSGVSECPFEILSRSFEFKRRLATVLLTVKSLQLPSTR
jgi:hypothetical protein